MWSNAVKEELNNLKEQREKQLAEYGAYRTRIIAQVVNSLEGLTTCPKHLVKQIAKDVALLKRARGRAIYLIGLSIQAQVSQAVKEAANCLGQHKEKMIAKIYEAYDEAAQEFSRETEKEVFNLVTQVREADNLSDAVNAYEDALALIEQSEFTIY